MRGTSALRSRRSHAQASCPPADVSNQRTLCENGTPGVTLEAEEICLPGPTLGSEDGKKSGLLRGCIQQPTLYMLIVGKLPGGDTALGQAVGEFHHLHGAHRQDDGGTERQQ